MSTVKPPILRNAITEASPNFLAFPLWLFWQRGDFFWAVAFSEMRIEDTPSELILLRGKMWRCSVFANYTASPAAFSKARFVKLPRPRICILQFFLSLFKITPLNSKVHLCLRKLILANMRKKPSLSMGKSCSTFTFQENRESAQKDTFVRISSWGQNEKPCTTLASRPLCGKILEFSTGPGQFV